MTYYWLLFFRICTHFGQVAVRPDDDKWSVLFSGPTLDSTPRSKPLQLQKGAVKFGVAIHGPLRMNRNYFRDPLNFSSGINIRLKFPIAEYTRNF